MNNTRTPRTVSSSNSEQGPSKLPNSRIVSSNNKSTSNSATNIDLPDFMSKNNNAKSKTKRTGKNTSRQKRKKGFVARLLNIKPSKIRPKKVIIFLLIALLIFIIAFPICLLFWANGQLSRVDALSSMSKTSGTTYLITGSDERDGAIGTDPSIAGGRSDTVMILHKPKTGPTALISLPRDTYVEIPGHGMDKLNAAFSLGGPPLTVQTVELLTGMKIDHYLGIEMKMMGSLVSQIGTVNLCSDLTVNDVHSQLKWKPGCHDVGPEQALAFARMRYQDPLGDIGREERQRQVTKQIMNKLSEPVRYLNPFGDISLVDAVTKNLKVDKKTGIIDLIFMIFAMKDANGSNGITGTPPIASMGYDPGTGVGSTVLLEDTYKDFFGKISAGTIPAGTVGGVK
jgi:LCP family protein required for cell wall assembly